MMSTNANAGDVDVPAWTAREERILPTFDFRELAKASAQRWPTSSGPLDRQSRVVFPNCLRSSSFAASSARFFLRGNVPPARLM
jgi:hypothetical protein